jgi:hypothetical protein
MITPIKQRRLEAVCIAMQVALIWGAHISFDRVVGWGLKHPDRFCNTDLGRRKLPIDIAILR